ncbi:tetratricopeptide repeat protein, partial [bacterium]
MTQPEPSRAFITLQQAQQALRLGNRTEARRFAMEAARLDPRLEEPWLILAALGSPDASLRYLQRALEINPNSERARRGMAWALRRQQESAAPTAPVALKPAQSTRPVRVAAPAPPVQAPPVQAPPVQA